MCYEVFIRRAFKCDYDAHNSKNSYFQNLIETETDSSSAKHLGSYEKQLIAIKKNIDKAIDKFLKSNPTADEASNLKSFKSKLTTSYYTSEIIELLNKGVEDTSRFRDL
jgi:glycine cleavage system protein P-like pyridoxal-binding family